MSKDLSQIQNLKTEEDIRATFSLMKQLRPHLTPEDYFQKVQLQRSEANYQLAALKIENRILCIAGYRISHSLSWGKFLYVDDLVTDETYRSQGLGKAMLNWLKDEGRKQGCLELHLDSGSQRLQAHAFYQRERLAEVGSHFSCKLLNA